MTAFCEALWAPEQGEEEAWVAAARCGSADAFNELVLRYQRQVHNLAYRIIEDSAAADDATQEAFISAYQSLGRFRGGSFRAWVLRIAANASHDELRRRRRQPKVSWADFGDLDEEANPHLADPGPNPEQSLQQQELRRVLERALGKLPEHQRLTLVLIDSLGLSYEEAAHVMGVALGTVKSRLARARSEMQRLLQEERELLPFRAWSPAPGR
ncbi:MAG: sigma-70 family RNA polymerase sigma factor [Anaerolineae bacterium]|nr:sigma-70 family RNA polymerase sigma factor [Anaerolineae bacterium]